MEGQNFNYINVFVKFKLELNLLRVPYSIYIYICWLSLPVGGIIFLQGFPQGSYSDSRGGAHCATKLKMLLAIDLTCKCF